MAWQIRVYETSSGQAVIEDFIVKLQPAGQAKLTRTLRLLEEHGAQLGIPYAKSLGSGLYELRIRGRQAEINNL